MDEYAAKPQNSRNPPNPLYQGAGAGEFMKRS